MKTTRNYLNNVTKHLFKFDNGNDSSTYYMKVIVKDDKFYKLKFNMDLELIERKEFKITETVSSDGKIYVPTELKNWTLFYRYDAYPSYNITGIKHFKSIKKLINEESMKIDKELELEKV